MKTVALADVCQVTMGQAPSGDTYNDLGLGLPLVAGAGDFGGLYPKPKKFTSATGVRTSRAGDVIVGIRASIGDKVLSDGIYCLGRGVAGLRAGPRLDGRYLWHWITHAAPRLAEKGRGATFLQVNKQDIAEMEIPLPPIEEQRRIAAVLDAADALRAKRRQALANLDTLTQAIFIDMFGDLANNSMRWPVRAVGEFVQAFETGRSVAAGPDDIPGGLRVLKVSAVTSRRFKAEESKPVPIAYRPPESHFVSAGDLLFSRANTTELVGACAYVHRTPPNHLLPDKLWRFVWRQPRTVEPLYVWWALQNRRVRQEIGELATGSSGSMKNISQSKFMSLQLPLPPIDVQAQFVERFGAVEVTRGQASDDLDFLDTLFASLQQRAFRGEL